MDAVSLRSSRDSGELLLGPVRYRGDVAWYRAALAGPAVSGAVEVRDRAPVRLAGFLRELSEKERLGAPSPERGTIGTWPGPRSV